MAGADKFLGGPAIVIWHRAVGAAAQAVAQLPPNQLAGLKVRAGEHLAAILITAFVGGPPTNVDTDGDVDLRFAWRQGFSLLPDPVDQVAFEIKSMAGPYRYFDHLLNVSGNPGDAHESSFAVQIERADDILADAMPMLERARHGLLRKTDDAVSRNIFLLIHMFDRLAAETIESPFIAAALAPLDVEADIDTVWVLWAPDHLTAWSTKTKVWTDLFFAAANREEVELEPAGLLTVLQSAESEFLSAIGYRGGSPYLFCLSAREGT